MLTIKKSARLLAALCLTSALALPSFAQDKMAPKMDKMAPKMDKMGDKMADHKMMGGKMMPKMSSDMMSHMSAMDKKTYKGMSKSEKMLMMKMMGMMHTKM